MNSYPPALRRTGFVAPRAVGRFGLAIMEARAAEPERAVQVSPRPAPHPAEVQPFRRTVVRLSASCTRAPVTPPSTATRAPAQIATTRECGATVSQPPDGSCILASATA